ncbi:MAG TPA: cytochrome C oxidase subunit IV family protein [Candidatus Omnitrophota bacterium]|nr:cytochrome C oxidase subunit IV family protein [Candidatus Omnitrophota bacterium]
MSEETHHPNVKIYYYVFATLLTLTVVTVLASFINVGIALGVAIALFIAVIKSSLVASFFMHLISEKKLIYYTLMMAGAFLLGMFVLFIFSYYNLPQGAEYIKEPAQQTQQHHEPAQKHTGEPHVP